MTNQIDLAALVKALVWEDSTQWTNAGSECPDGTIRNYRAITPFGAYFIDQQGTEYRSCWRDGVIPSWESDWGRLEAAKAAAQADYEARIMSALTVIDAKALVKAAKALDEAHTSMMNNCDAEAFRILDVSLAELEDKTDG